MAPRRFGVNEILNGIGRPEAFSRKHGWRPDSGQPTNGVVTFKNGRVVRLAVAA
jgi:hypothetical protein